MLIYLFTLEIPDLLSNLQDVMKSYIMQETKYHDLKKSIQTVLQDYMQKVANNPGDTNFTLDEINEVKHIDNAKNLVKEEQLNVPILIIVTVAENYSFKGNRETS